MNGNAVFHAITATLRLFASRFSPNALSRTRRVAILGIPRSALAAGISPLVAPPRSLPDLSLCSSWLVRPPLFLPPPAQSACEFCFPFRFRHARFPLAGPAVARCVLRSSRPSPPVD